MTNKETVRNSKAGNMIQSQIIPLSEMTPNKGQIPGVPKNPRAISKTKLELLKRSIEDDPEMLELREILVYPYGGKHVVIGGNMRYRALKELGYTEAIVKVLPEETTPEKLRAIAIKDNSGFGEWDWDMLANEWDAADLGNWGVDIPTWENDENMSFENKMSTSTECNYLKFGKIKIPITEDELNGLMAIHEEYLETNGTNLGFALQLVEIWKQ